MQNDSNHNSLSKENLQIDEQIFVDLITLGIIHLYEISRLSVVG